MPISAITIIRVIKAITIITVVLWIFLYLSSYGILVWSKLDDLGNGIHMKACAYFNGTGISTRDDIVIIGPSYQDQERIECQRLLKVAP
jgi:hypothetical protein